jgi:hypothetical protein
MASKKKKAPKRPAIKRSLKMAKKRHAIEKKHVQKAVAMKPATAKKLTIVKRPVVAAKQLIIAAQKKRMVPGKVIPLRSHEKLLEALAKKAEEAKKSMAAAREAGMAPPAMRLETASTQKRGDAEIKDLRVRRQSLIEDLKQKREALRSIPRNGKHKEKIMTVSKQLTDIKQELWEIDSELKLGGGLEAPKK